MTKYPDADAYLKVWRAKGAMHEWLVHCPFCGNMHRHGAGRILHEIQDNLGLRVSPCSHGTSYNLVHVGNEFDMYKTEWYKWLRRTGWRDNHYRPSDLDFNREMRFPFGKYRKHTPLEVIDLDPDYIDMILKWPWFTKPYPRAAADLRALIEERKTS